MTNEINMATLGEQTKAWIADMRKPEKQQNDLEMAADSSNSPVVTWTLASPSYLTAAGENESAGSAPNSIYEGLQTVLDLSRANAGFEPKHPQEQGGSLNLTHFTDSMAGIPFFDFKGAQTESIDLRTPDGKALINYLAQFVIPIIPESKSTVNEHVGKMLAYSLVLPNPGNEPRQLLAHYLSMDPSGNLIAAFSRTSFDLTFKFDDGSLIFDLAGTSQNVQYEFKSMVWEDIKDNFAALTKVTIHQWLDVMNTPIPIGVIS